MTPLDAAHSFAALGHHDRVRICHLLILSGDQGVTRTSISTTLAIHRVKVDYHLRKLQRVHLIKRHRDGHTVSWILNGWAMDGLSKYLSDDAEHGRMAIRRTYSYEYDD